MVGKRMQRAEQVLKWLQSNPGFHTAKDIAKGCGVSYLVANTALNHLHEEGVIARDAIPRPLPGRGYSRIYSADKQEKKSDASNSGHGNDGIQEAGGTDSGVPD